jgi:lipopolysaccharide export system protein LptA
MLFTCREVQAWQKPAADSARKTKLIQILDNQYGEFIQNDTNSVHKLKGNVKLLHGSDTLYCDSAYFYTKKNSVEAFGDVVVRQADFTEASADYMRYNGATKVVYMRADAPDREVQLYDGKVNTLWSREIDYNLNTKVGRYKKRGYLQTKTTVLESNTGAYNLKTKDARFKGDVIVNDPEYRALSADLGYNTGTEVVRFFGPSVVSNDQSILQTRNGIYDTRNRKARFVERASILNQAQYTEADTLDYDRNSGYAIAIGKVIAIDTGLKATMYCGYAIYNEIYKTMMAYDKPLMKKTDGKDSLFIRFDSLYSAPDPSYKKTLTAQESLQRTADIISAAAAGRDSLQQQDSTLLADTTVIVPVMDSLSAQAAAGDSATEPGLVPGESMVMDTVPPPAGEVVADTLKETGKAVPPGSDSVQVKPSVVDEMKRKMDAMVYRRKDAETQRITAGTDTAASLLTPLEQRRRLDSASMTYNNTPVADTSAPRYFVGYRNVLIYSDSLQGKCDSIRYSQVDSVLRMYINPLLWPRNSQMKGDMIFMRLDSNKLKEVHIPKNAIMATRSGPEKAGMYDQIQGNTIRAYLRNNKLDSLIAEPNASSIYFIRDDDSAYVGSSEAKSERIEVLFENEEINLIYYRKDVEQKTTPMKDVVPSGLHLSRFSWEEKLRPKSLEEFLEGTTRPFAPSLLLMEPGPEPVEEPLQPLPQSDTGTVEIKTN